MNKISLIFIILSIIGLTACSSNSIKRDPFAPAIDEKFALKGHLEPKPKIADVLGENVAPIPNLLQAPAIIIDPNKHQAKKLYSVSAINVPVEELLFKLAVDANKELDLSAKVSGNVTINALRQPLDTILQRISEQVGAVFQTTNRLIVIRKDLPFWYTYRIDYVNITKEVKDTMLMKMAIGGGAGGSGQASEFEMRTSSKHDIWQTLYNNINAMAIVNTTISQQNTGAESAEAPTDVTGKIVALNREAGLISVNTTRANHFTIRNYINSVISRATRQVLIEATVVEVELSDKYQAGVDWSGVTSAGAVTGNMVQNMLGENLSADPSFSINLSALNFAGFNFNLGIKMLQQFGDARVLSSPKIMALNNQSALLKVVNNEVYFTVGVETVAATATSPATTVYTTQVNTVPVGFMMNITPFISDSDEVTLNIRPTLSRIVGHVNDPNPELARAGVVSRIPIIQEREMSSTLRLRNRQTAILGGLIQDQHNNQRVGIPFLSSIPGIGDLFSFRSDEVKKTELIIFIRPVIIENPDIDHGDLQNMKYFLKTGAS